VNVFVHSILHFIYFKLARKKKGQCLHRFFHRGGVAVPLGEFALVPVEPLAVPVPILPVMSYTATWSFEVEIKARRGAYTMDSLMDLHDAVSSIHYGYESEKAAVIRHLKEFYNNAIKPICTRTVQVSDNIIFVEAGDSDLVDILGRLQSTAMARNKFGFTEESSPQRQGASGGSSAAGFQTPSTPMTQRSDSGINDAAQAYKVAVQDLAFFLNKTSKFKNRQRFEDQNGIVWA